MLIVLSVLWGGSFFFIGIAVAELPPLTIVALRVGLAAIALWSIVFIIGLRPPKSLDVWKAFFGMGLLNNVIPFTLIVWGQVQIASGLASILNATTPLFTVVVAGMLLADERFTRLKVLGVAIGLIGVVVMIGPPVLSGSGATIAKLAVLGGALSYAFAGVYGRRFKTMTVSPIVTAAGQVTASALFMAPLAWFVDGRLDIAGPSLGTWGAVIALAVFSTAAAYILYFRILEAAGATNLLLVTLLIPVSAIWLGSIFLNESLEFEHFVGMALIAFGLSSIDGRLWQRRVPREGLKSAPSSSEQETNQR